MVSRTLFIVSIDVLFDNNFFTGGRNVEGHRIIVEIDESKFGKRKYHNGHHVEGVWVLGGVERTPERKVFLQVVEERTTPNLRNIIVDHVLPGSLVHTDCWRGYNRLNDWRSDDRIPMDYQHESVNHSIEYVRSDGVHTNTIEGKSFFKLITCSFFLYIVGNWNAIKMMTPARQRTNAQMPMKLIEFIWRRKNKENFWQAILAAMKEVSFSFDDIIEGNNFFIVLFML